MCYVYQDIVTVDHLNNPEGPVDRNQIISYLYIAWWSYKFYFRQAIIGPLAPILLIVLSIVDVVGPVTDWLPIAGTERARYAIALSLFLVALVLIWHHHRLMRRIERLQLVLTSTMVLLEDQSMRRRKKGEGEQRRQHSVTNILDAVVFALEHHYPDRKVAATVMTRDSEGRPFRIYSQDPRRTFDPGTILHNTQSAAGYTAQEPLGTLLYVPRAKFVHAARIGAERAGAAKEIFRKSSIVPNAFQICPKDPDHLQSLLCVRVPLPGVSMPECAILCISRGQPNGMGDLEFHTIKVAAALVGLALLG
jgi:hypothetical protein